jgi:hypothetical protein
MLQVEPAGMILKRRPQSHYFINSESGSSIIFIIIITNIATHA